MEYIIELIEFLCGKPTDVLSISGNDDLDYSGFATSIGMIDLDTPIIKLQL